MSTDDENELLYAAESNNVESLNALIAKNVNVNVAGCSDMTPLHLAAREGHSVIARLLVKKGANVNARSYLGSTPLELAACNGNSEIVSLLIENGADVHVEGKNGGILHCAAQSGHEQIVQIIIEKGANLNAKDSKSHTPLYCAAFNGHKEVVRILVDKGADMNAADNEGCTALYAAVDNNREDVARLLIEKGADINARRTGCVSLLEMAARKGQIEVVRLLMDKGTGKDIALQRAAGEGQKEVVRLLIDNGVDLNARDGDGRTALHHASGYYILGHGSEERRVEVVRLLIERGADIHAVDNYGKTPYDMDSTKEIKKLLRMAGAGRVWRWLGRLWGGYKKTKKQRQVFVEAASDGNQPSEASPATGSTKQSEVQDVVSDTTTLMWQKIHENKKMTQQEALDYCSSLKLANHSDWTLPTLAQLRRLQPALRSQLSEAGDVFWTATDFEHRPETQAYASDGTSFNKTERLFVRAVRRL